MQGSKVQRDWANLPAEMVTLISEKTNTNKMYVHLRAVCKAWRRALTPHPRHLPRQFPWLLLPQYPHESCSRVGADDSRICFFDLSQSKTHWFELPKVSGKSIYGSSYGWLVLKHYNSVSLLNPITRSSIDLPPINAIPNGRLSLHWAELQKQHCTEKVMLTCSPSENDCIVVSCAAPTSPDWELVFCRIGDTHWTGLKRRDGRKRLLDFTLHKNSVYTVNNKKEVSVYNLQTLESWTYPSTIKYYAARDHINLVGGDEESGGPLVVYSPEFLRASNKIYVYKWFNDLQKWCQVSDIGKRVLFLTRDNCTNLQFEEEQGNEIYYDLWHNLGNYSYGVGINRLNFRSGSDVPHKTRPLEAFPNVCGRLSWFTPSLTRYCKKS